MAKRRREDGTFAYEGLWWVFARPGFILLIHGGIFLTAIGIAGRREAGWSLALSVAVAAGFLLWTLFEYAFHRWLLHHTRRPLLRKVFWEWLHRDHHSYRRMKDPDHHGIHPAQSLPVVLVFFLPVLLGEDGGVGLAVFAGWLSGYMLYETLHWVFHTLPLDGRVASLPGLRGLWISHAVHHLESVRRNYGFVTMLWDRVLGTYSPPRRREALIAAEEPR